MYGWVRVWLAYAYGYNNEIFIHYRNFKTQNYEVLPCHRNS